MGLFNRSQKSKRVAIFHIGSAGVHVGLIELKQVKENIIPEIIFTSNSDMPVTEVLDFSTFQSMMEKALEKAGNTLRDAKLGAPDEIVCFLGSPWFAAQTRTIKLEKKTPFVVTHKLIDDLVNKEIEAFEKEELVKYEEAGNKATLIEREITNISLNGYSVTDAYNQKTNSLELSLMVSMSPSVVVEKIIHQINSSYSNLKIRFHSFIFAGTLATRDLFITKENFLFVDIGGEITDVALVKNGMVVDMVSFPFGKNVILREFALGMTKKIPEAQSLLALCRDKKLEATLQMKADKIISNSMDGWVMLFKSTLSRLATQFLLPETVALTATPDMQLFFNNAIGSDVFSQFTLTEKPFVIIPVTTQALNPFIRVRAETFLNAFIVIESIVVARKNI